MYLNFFTPLYQNVSNKELEIKFVLCVYNSFILKMIFDRLYDIQVMRIRKIQVRNIPVCFIGMGSIAISSAIIFQVIRSSKVRI